MKKKLFIFILSLLCLSAFAKEKAPANNYKNMHITTTDEAVEILLPQTEKIYHCIVFHLMPLTDRVTFDFISGTKTRTFKYNNTIKQSDVSFYLSTLGFIPEKIKIRPDWDSLEYSVPAINIFTGLELKSFDKYAQAPLSPVSGDCYQILHNKPESWRFTDWEIFAWESFPGIIVFDTLNYNIQANIFRRLAFFSEKKGYTGKIHTFTALSGKADWNGHNYLSKDLARFFNFAEKNKVLLTSGEIFLKNMLLENGIIKYKNRQFYGNDCTGVVSISQESNNFLRGLLLTHEGFHGLYYAVEDLRNLMEDGWQNLIPEAQDIWLDYLKTQKAWNYNYQDLYLVKNELFGYMMQQKDFGAYFDKMLFPRVINNCPDKASVHSDNREAIKESLCNLAETLSQYLKYHLNLDAGNLFYMYEIKE